jgi:hypothetical protein
LIGTEDYEARESDAGGFDPATDDPPSGKPVAVPGADRSERVGGSPYRRKREPATSSETSTGERPPPGDPPFHLGSLETDGPRTPGVVTRYPLALPALRELPAETSSSLVNLVATFDHRDPLARVDESPGAAWRILSWATYPAPRTPRRRSGGNPRNLGPLGALQPGGGWARSGARATAVTPGSPPHPRSEGDRDSSSSTDL